jgi:hypothetical protein
VEEEQGEQGNNGEGEVQEIPPLIGENRKEHSKEQSTHKHKKRKFFKPLEKIGSIDPIFD